MNAPAQIERRPRGMASAVVIWLVLQVLLLALVIFDSRITARGGDHVRAFALQFTLIGQIIVLVMIFPLLLRTVAASGVALAAGFAALQVAGRVGNESAADALLCTVALLGFIVVLHLWCRLLRTERASLIASAVATFYTLGSTGLWYLLSEFAGDRQAIRILESISPLLCAGRYPSHLALLTLLAIHVAIVGTFVIWRGRSRVLQSADE